MNYVINVRICLTSLNLNRTKRRRHDILVINIVRLYFVQNMEYFYGRGKALFDFEIIYIQAVEMLSILHLLLLKFGATVILHMSFDYRFYC